MPQEQGLQAGQIPSGSPSSPPIPAPLDLFPDEVATPTDPAARVRVLLEVDALAANGVQMREQLDEATVVMYAKRMKAMLEEGSTEPPFPPLRAFVGNLRPWQAYADGLERRAAADSPPPPPMPNAAEVVLVDGFHRLEAARRIDRVLILVELRQGTRRQAVLYASSANISHGLPANAADRRRATLILLSDPEWSQWADREIARHTGASPRTVGRIRRELGTAAESETRRYLRGGVEEVYRVPDLGERPDGLGDLFGGGGGEGVAEADGTCNGDGDSAADSTCNGDSAPAPAEPQRPETCGDAAAEGPPQPTSQQRMKPRVYPAMIAAEEALTPQQRHLVRRWAYTHGDLPVMEPSVERLADLPTDLDTCEDGRGFTDLEVHLGPFSQIIGRSYRLDGDCDDCDGRPLERLADGAVRLRLGLATAYAVADARFRGVRDRENAWARRRAEQLAAEVGACRVELEVQGHGPRVIRLWLSDDDGGGVCIRAARYPHNLSGMVRLHRGDEWAATVADLEERVAAMRAALARASRA